MDDVKTAQIEH